MFDIYCLLIERLFCSLLFIYMAIMIINIIHVNSYFSYNNGRNVVSSKKM